VVHGERSGLSPMGVCNFPLFSLFFLMIAGFHSKREETVREPAMEADTSFKKKKGKKGKKFLIMRTMSN
jgi:hypothetical protein